MRRGLFAGRGIVGSVSRPDPRLVAAVLALLALAGCDRPGDTGVQQPPGRYRDRDATFTLRLVDIAQVEPICRAMGGHVAPGRRIGACHRALTVVMPRPSQVSAAYFVALLVHEIGHVLGWPGDHPLN